MYAGVVQRLVCDLAKVEMAVRFRSLAPVTFLFELLEFELEIHINPFGLIFCLQKINKGRMVYLMIKFTPQELEMESSLKQRIKFICIKGLSASLKNINSNTQNDKSTIRILKQNNESLELRVKNLTEKVENQKEQIDDLRQDNYNLRYQFQQLEQLFKRLVNFFKRMLNRKDKEEVYSEVVNDMYNNQIINENTYDNILDYSDNLDKEKDNYEL